MVQRPHDLLRPLKGESGETGTVRATVAGLRDPGSVKRLIEVEKA